jgi:hypothetical protein
MPILEGQVNAVIGVDTHRDRHAAALLDPNGGVRATLEVPSDRAGHTRLLRLADAQAPGRRVWALEGTGCYGAGPDPVSGRPWRVGGRDRQAQAAPGPPRGQERPLGRHPSRPRPWPATTSPAPASAGTEKRFGCCTPPGLPSWPPGRTPAASSRP